MIFIRPAVINLDVALIAVRERARGVELIAFELAVDRRGVETRVAEQGFRHRVNQVRGDDVSGEGNAVARGVALERVVELRPLARRANARRVILRTEGRK